MKGVTTEDVYFLLTIILLLAILFFLLYLILGGNICYDTFQGWRCVGDAGEIVSRSGGGTDRGLHAA